MKTIKIYEVGDEITFTEFAFNNVHGGTGLSNWDHDEKFSGVAGGTILKAWEDYECGWRFWVKPGSPDLIRYVKKHSKKQIVYVSEFDII